MKLISKMSMKAIGAQPKKNSFHTVEGEGANEKVIKKEPQLLASIFGRASRYEVGTTTYGEFTKFRGSFESTVFETGENFQSGAIFLPGILESLLIGALDNSDDKPVDFAVVIGAQYADNAFGYEYTIDPVVAPKASDELGALRDKLAKVSPKPKEKDNKAEGKK